MVVGILFLISIALTVYAIIVSADNAEKKKDAEYWRDKYETLLRDYELKKRNQNN